MALSATKNQGIHTPGVSVPNPHEDARAQDERIAANFPKPHANLGLQGCRSEAILAVAALKVHDLWPLFFRSKLAVDGLGSGNEM